MSAAEFAKMKALEARIEVLEAKERAREAKSKQTLTLPAKEKAA
jgi:BMFP domain-containing protein YqiC